MKEKTQKVNKLECQENNGNMIEKWVRLKSDNLVKYFNLSLPTNMLTRKDTRACHLFYRTYSDCKTI